MEAANICSDTDVDIHSAERVCNSFHNARSEQYERNTQYPTSSMFCMGCRMEFAMTNLRTVFTRNLFKHF